ncbi:MAG: hypothetical protein LIP09_05485 [Bacteroidales bacterium]|nr:hypothetical protein [Bacteroidales bacterium]
MKLLTLSPALIKVAFTSLTIIFCSVHGEAEEARGVAPWDAAEMFDAPLAQRLALVEEVLNSQFSEDEGNVKLVEWDHQVEFQICGKDVEKITRDECVSFLKKMIQMITVFHAYADQEYDFLFNIQSKDAMDIKVYVISPKEYSEIQPMTAES